jgi:hypothetical protein
MVLSNRLKRPPRHVNIQLPDLKKYPEGTVDDNREKDRRKKEKPVPLNRRKGPRRLTCDCGGKIEIALNEKENFVCARCGKKF